MNRRYLIIAILISASTARGSSNTNGPNGINSIGTHLTGLGIAIGQGEPGRAGKPGYDNILNYASNTFPAGVYRQGVGGMDTPDSDLIFQEHATEVAGVMIARAFPSVMPVSPCIECAGVAPRAQLHSIAIRINDDNEVALALNRIATLPVADVKAINLSFGIPLEPVIENTDGNSHMTQFIDWSARRHDVLYVVSWGNEGQDDPRKPQDNYNGVVVTGAERVDGVYRRWWFGNATAGDAEGTRTSVDLMAPAESIEVLSTADLHWTDAEGTSYAAPHVTGTVALMQEYAVRQMNLPTPNPRFGPNSQHHETMKAALLNSADKLAGVHGSTRTAWDNNNEDWTLTAAYASPDISLDEVMGAGLLNAKRAVQQIATGEYDPGIVPSIGWDYGTVGGGGTQEYTFDTAIGGGYIAATLVWDRRNEHTGGNTYHDGDLFFFQTVEDSLNNLDLYLLPADQTELSPAITASTTLVDNVEHIFFNIPVAGTYKLVVHNNPLGGIGDAQNYALAWWYGNNPPALFVPGDFNNNGTVGAEDYDVWRSTFGSAVDPGTEADGNENGIIDAGDYVVWRNGLTAGGGTSLALVPEPPASILILCCAFELVRSGRREPRGSRPPTPPYVRFRIQRF